MTAPREIAPYTMTDQPTSAGRTLLAKAFAFYCVLQWGFDDVEVESALRRVQGMDPAIIDRVLGAAQLIGQAMQLGAVEAYARPFGGGAPSLLPASAWEMDDFAPRFATSAIDPKRPFDREAAPTHWLFVHTAMFDDLLAILEGQRGWSSARTPACHGATEAAAATSDVDPAREDRFLKKADVLRLVPFPEARWMTGCGAASFRRAGISAEVLWCGASRRFGDGWRTSWEPIAPEAVQRLLRRGPDAVTEMSSAPSRMRVAQSSANSRRRSM